MIGVEPAAAAILVKTPGHSPVKTRLARGVGVPRAEQLHLACAQAVADVLPLCTPQPVGYFAVAEEHALAGWPGLPCVAQGAGGLGARLHRVYADLQARHGAVLLLGADAPQVDAALLDRALAWVAGRGPRIAIGMAADGGFWLFAANVVLPEEAWTQVAYSRADTGAALLAAVAPHGVVHELPVLRDLDAQEDLAPVLSALDALPRRTPSQDRVAALLRAALDLPAAS